MLCFGYVGGAVSQFMSKLNQWSFCDWNPLGAKGKITESGAELESCLKSKPIWS